MHCGYLSLRHNWNTQSLRRNCWNLSLMITETSTTVSRKSTARKLFLPPLFPLPSLPGRGQRATSVVVEAVAAVAAVVAVVAVVAVQIINGDGVSVQARSQSIELWRPCPCGHDPRSCTCVQGPKKSIPSAHHQSRRHELAAIDAATAPRQGCRRPQAMRDLKGPSPPSRRNSVKIPSRSRLTQCMYPLLNQA